MKVKFAITLLASVVAFASLCAGQGITLESVDGQIGPDIDSTIVADGATPIVFNLRLQGIGVPCAGFTAGLRVHSDDAVWGTAVADTLDVGTPWDVMWESPGGFFINEFSVNGSGADTIGLGALAVGGTGFAAGFDDVAFSITIGPISPDQAGKTITLDSCFYPPNGYWMMAGSSGSFDWGGPYEFTLAQPTIVVDGEGGLPNSFALRQNYPNPFNPSTEIFFDVPRRSHVRLAIYNVLGQVVKTLVDQEMPAGSYMRTWDGRTESGASISSGIYLYRMDADDFRATRKMMLLK